MARVVVAVCDTLGAVMRSSRVLGWLALAACGEPTPGGPDARLAVTVVSPNGGEALIAAEAIELAWALAPAEAVPCDVELIDGEGRATTIAAGVTAMSLTWSPPGVAAPAPFRIRVTARAVDGLTVEDASDEAFTISPPATGVSLARDVQPIFTAGCTTRFCHGADSQVALLNLSAGAAHGALVGVGSVAAACSAQVRVRPGQPDQSYLLWKLAGAGPCVAGVRMPKGAAALAAGEVNVIRTWIAEGARPN